MLRDVENAGESTAQSYMSGLEGGLEINSPARAPQRSGVKAGEGLIKGTKEIQPRVIEIARILALAFVGGIADTITSNQDIDNAIRRQVEDMRRTADMAVMNANFDGIGFNIITTVANGINNGGGILANAAQNMINIAFMAMQAAAQINSPSKRAEGISDRIGDGLINRMIKRGKQFAEVCKQIADKAMENLYVDPADLIANAQDILQSMQLALPALESNIQYTTNPHRISANNQPPVQVTVDMTHGRYYIREDADIDRLAKAVKKELSNDADYATRVTGGVFAW